MDQESFKIYGQSRIGKNAIIGERVMIGYPTADILKLAASSGKNIEDLNFKGACDPGCTGVEIRHRLPCQDKRATTRT